jgi:deazaflavin-dependent oxidoreductase (nitroreductase family)
MPPRSKKLNWFGQLYEKLAASRFAATYILPIACRIDRWLIPASHGRLSTTIIWPVLLLNTIGAKSGKARTTPLVYLTDGENIIVVASNGGNTHHPNWYYNLRAHPETSYMLHGQIVQCVARETSGEERERLWGKVIDLYAGYDAYQDFTQGRKIPVMVLMPKK